MRGKRGRTHDGYETMEVQRLGFRLPPKRDGTSDTDWFQWHECKVVSRTLERTELEIDCLELPAGIPAVYEIRGRIGYVFTPIEIIYFAELTEREDGKDGEKGGWHGCYAVNSTTELSHDMTQYMR